MKELKRKVSSDTSTKRLNTCKMDHSCITCSRTQSKFAPNEDGHIQNQLPETNSGQGLDKVLEIQLNRGKI